MRSMLYTGLLFPLSVVRPGGKIFDLREILGNKSMAIVYTISIVIRSLTGLVPDKANRDKNEDTPADESGSKYGTRSSGEVYSSQARRKEHSA